MSGDPDPKHVSTSYVERQNLTMRMHMRRFTRLNQWALEEDRESLLCRSLALHVLQLLQDSSDATDDPAMEAGLADRVWAIEELVNLIS